MRRALARAGRLPPVEMDSLREPKGPFQEMIRRLAEVAMSITHHDANDADEGYIHEVQSMETRFTSILRGYLSAETKRRQARDRAHSAVDDGENGR